MSTLVQFSAAAIPLTQTTVTHLVFGTELGAGATNAPESIVLLLFSGLMSVAFFEWKNWRQ
jgi:hypothetical protein